MYRRFKVERIFSLLGLAISVLFPSFFGSCHQVSQPPSPMIIIKTFYKTSAGADLLNPGTPGSFKKADISVKHKIEVKGATQEVTYNHTVIYVDDQTGFNYIELAVLTNFGKNPLETYVTLSSAVTDTVTYYFATPAKFQYIPDKVYYNKRLVWDAMNVKGGEGAWPPITIIK